MHTVASRHSERRSEERFERTEMRVCLLASSGASLEPDTVLIDLSSRGLGLETGTPLKAGETVRFRIELPSGPIGGTAEVRWIRSHRRGFRCGALVRRLSWLHARRLESFLRPGDGRRRPLLDSLAGFCALALAVFFLFEVYGVPAGALWSRLRALLGR